MTPDVLLTSPLEKVASCKSNTNGSHLQKSTLLEIVTLESIEQGRPAYLKEISRTDCFEIIWITKGNGQLMVDCQETAISGNTLYCLSPGQLRQFFTHGKLEGYYIKIVHEFLYLAENKSDFSFLTGQNSFGRSLQIIQADKEMQYELEDVVMRMIKEAANYFLLRTEILRGLLKIFLIYLSRKTQAQTRMDVPDKDTIVVDKFMALLKRHYTTKRMVADYAEELCVTPNYLNRIVKKVSGFPASHHIQQYIILEAKRQAMYSGMSMKQVAYELGFSDYAHFSKFFKNNSGMNFTAFKNGIQ